MGDHGAQVLQIQKQKTFVIGQFKGDVQHAFLCFVEVQHPRQQKRPDLRDRCPERMALLAKHIPEDSRKAFKLVAVRKADFLCALQQEVLWISRHGNARQIAFHIGAEHRNACLREAFGKDLQCHRLAGAGGSRDEAVPVGKLEVQHFVLAAATNENAVRHGFRPLASVFQ